MSNLRITHCMRVYDSVWMEAKKEQGLLTVSRRFSARLCHGVVRLVCARHRAIRNGTHLTRAHIWRKPRAFHPVQVGDKVRVWKWERGYSFFRNGEIEAVQVGWCGSPLVRVLGEWFRFSQTDYTGYTYV